MHSGKKRILSLVAGLFLLEAGTAALLMTRTQTPPAAMTAYAAPGLHLPGEANERQAYEEIRMIIYSMVEEPSKIQFPEYGPKLVSHDGHGVYTVSGYYMYDFKPTSRQHYTARIKRAEGEWQCLEIDWPN